MHICRLFAERGKPMLLVTFRRSRNFMHCVTDVQGRNRSSCDTTTHGTTLLVCACTGFRRMAGNLFPVHPSPLRLLSVRIRKGSDTRPTLCDQRAIQEVVRHCLRTAEKAFYGKGIFTLPEKCKNASMTMGISAAA